MQGLKREVIKAVTGDSAFPLNLLSSLVQETEHKCVALKQAYEEAQYNVDENEKFLQELEKKYNQFIACFHQNELFRFPMVEISGIEGWYDKQGRVYIYYTLDEIQEDMNCGHDKATKLLVELDNGI